MKLSYVIAAIGAAVVGYWVVDRFTKSASPSVRTQSFADGVAAAWNGATSSWETGPGAPGNTTPSAPAPLELSALTAQAWSIASSFLSDEKQPPLGSLDPPTSPVNQRLALPYVA
jgi:hypothetical protein